MKNFPLPLVRTFIHKVNFPFLPHWNKIHWSFVDVFFILWIHYSGETFPLVNFEGEIYDDKKFTTYVPLDMKFFLLKNIIRSKKNHKFSSKIYKKKQHGT